MEKRLIRNQKGFTLIEIIAVLVILGILAAVAVPKYLSMQTEAQNKAIAGALAALKSQSTMEYSRDLLTGSATATSWTPAVSTYTIGDFEGSYTNSAGTVSVVVNSGPNWFAAAPGSNKSGSFTLY